MKKLLLLLLFFPMTMYAQKGIQFVHGMLWKDVVAKARSERKYIFVDAFATWCGPCQYMAANVFTADKVGDVFNSQFINVKMQMDTSGKDNEDVKKLYEDAHYMSKKYSVLVYPTFLFFNSDGKLVHRFAGSMEAAEFALKGKSLADESNQYYPMLDKYKAGGKVPEFLKKLAYAADDAYDQQNAKLIGKDYLATQNDFLTDANLQFIFRFTQSSQDAGFSVLLNQEAKINKIKGDRSATEKLVEIISQEELYPYFKRQISTGPDWKTINTYIAKKYPGLADEVIASGKVSYYQSKADWNNFQNTIQQYMIRYGEIVSPSVLNSYAWTVFENCTDPACLKAALDWSKRSFAENADPAFIDTYANLLYKMGRKEEALEWEQKAMKVVPEEQHGDYKTAIEKMKKNEKTWNQ